MSECEEIATTINRLVKAGHMAKAQELLESSLNYYFVLQLAMFADKKVNAYTTIAAWKQAGLRLPAEDTPEFYPYGDSPSATEEQLASPSSPQHSPFPIYTPPSDSDKRTTVGAKITYCLRWLAVIPGAVLAG